jgi:hypothetical protein
MKLTFMFGTLFLFLGLVNMDYSEGEKTQINTTSPTDRIGGCSYSQLTTQEAGIDYIYYYETCRDKDNRFITKNRKEVKSV